MQYIIGVTYNLEGYDSHLFIKNLGVTEGDINCIPKNEEKYISFTKTIVVETINSENKESLNNWLVKRQLQFEEMDELFINDKISTEEFKKCMDEIEKESSEESEEELKNKIETKRQLRFIDSFKFISSSLGKLADNLDKEKFHSVGKYFQGKKQELLIWKGVYPYDYVDHLDKLLETKLPPKEAFYSLLNDEGISDEDYKHAQNVWKEFRMKSMRDYHDLYLKTDVLLLADAFEEFRKVCLDNYKLDPAWYYTSPGLAWDAMLKLTNVKLELLTDPNMYLMVEKGIRGVSMISTQYGKANNPCMEDKYDHNFPTKYISYLDANNLYGWAMSKPLPTHGF